MRITSLEKIVSTACLPILLLSLAWSANAAESAPRARDLGIPFEGTPAPLNAITDVPGLTVGHSTIIEDFPDGRAARTGVTAILPRGAATVTDPVFGASAVLNGAGELTGTIWLEASGFLEGPVMLTNSLGVGSVFEATTRWRVNHAAPDPTGYAWPDPIVGETWDGGLNDANGFHVRDQHVREAIESARTGTVEEGNVGGGTGMVCYQFKCGIGTSSRVATTVDGDFVVGVLVQANYGAREHLRIAGVPVGQAMPLASIAQRRTPLDDEMGSIIVVIASNAPLLPHQLKRVATRAGLGIGRNGGIATNGSGDIFIAFSTANAGEKRTGKNLSVRMMGNENINPILQATVEATEEAIINALIAARDMTGNKGETVYAIDHDELRKILREYRRLDD